MICFILNNLRFPMVEGIAFYALYKLRVLIIPCKSSWLLFIYMATRWHLKKTRLIPLSNLEFIFKIFFFWSNLKETLHYSSYMVSNIKHLHSVLNNFFSYKSKRSKYEVEKVAIWQHLLISGKHGHTPF